MSAEDEVDYSDTELDHHYAPPTFVNAHGLRGVKRRHSSSDTNLDMDHSDTNDSNKKPTGGRETFEVTNRTRDSASPRYQPPPGEIDDAVLLQERRERGQLESSNATEGDEDDDLRNARGDEEEEGAEGRDPADPQAAFATHVAHVLSEYALAICCVGYTVPELRFLASRVMKDMDDVTVCYAPTGHFDITSYIGTDPVLLNRFDTQYDILRKVKDFGAREDTADDVLRRISATSPLKCILFTHPAEGVTYGLCSFLLPLAATLSDVATYSSAIQRSLDQSSVPLFSPGFVDLYRGGWDSLLRAAGRTRQYGVAPDERPPGVYLAENGLLICVEETNGVRSEHFITDVDFDAEPLT